MKFHSPSSPVVAANRQGFTMVEIAMSLAIISIALVAILGVLPTGMTVQKENREDTVINQDGTFLLEAIRGGSLGLDYLTNHVDRIDITTVPDRGAVQTVSYFGPGPAFDSVSQEFRLDSGRKIIGLLSTPRYGRGGRGGNISLTNIVTADVRAISGPASQQGSAAASRDFAFGYRITVGIEPLNVIPGGETNLNGGNLTDVERQTRTNRWLQALNVQENFHEVRLTFQWPLFESGGAATNAVGSNTKTFRTITPGRYVLTNDGAGTVLYFIESDKFNRVKLQ